VKYKYDDKNIENEGTVVSEVQIKIQFKPLGIFKRLREYASINQITMNEL